MGDATAPAVQLPHQHTLELAQTGVAQKLVQARAAGGSPAESRIYLLLKDLPAQPSDVFSERVELHIATLVRRTDSSVNGDDHGF